IFLNEKKRRDDKRRRRTRRNLVTGRSILLLNNRNLVRLSLLRRRLRCHIRNRFHLFKANNKQPRI
ncbi:unnamed protein product, partial [Arabidopsis halleri]